MSVIGSSTAPDQQRTRAGNSLTAPDDRLKCPRCGEPAYRVRRSPLDKFISLFRLVHRYRCSDAWCAWEGRQRQIGQARPPSLPRT